MIRWTVIQSNLRKRHVQVVLAAAVWILVMLLGSLPAWRSARRNDQNVDVMSSQLASQTEWSAAGLWLTESAQRWEPVLSEDYDRLFPGEKNQEELFLEIARVARLSGIETLSLVPEVDGRREETDDDNDDMMMDDIGGFDLDQLVANLPMGAPEFLGSTIDDYQVTAAFETGFGQLVAFLDGLKGISRLVNVASLHTAPAREGIAVEMELEFYVQVRD
ncbi:MAG: hypothetical protein ABIF77_05515 [bacterium]